jgi:addiction module HigA family antidote
MAKKLAPIHPGEILADVFMSPNRLSANRLSLDLHIPANRVTEIIRGRRAITADTALRLARYFDTSAELWLGLQQDYDLQKTTDEMGARIERDVRVAAA